MKTMTLRIISALLLLSLQSCSFLHYYPGEETSNTCLSWTYDQCVDKYGKPDEEVASSNGEILLIYYSGRKILSGRGIFKRAIHKERHVFVLKDIKIIDEFYVVQVIEGSRWGCGNISGHGGFCGTWHKKSCSQYNKTNTTLCGIRNELEIYKRNK